MATPNYGYEKRQRELAKKRKAEEKRMKKLQGGPGGNDHAPQTGDNGPSEPAAQAESAPPAGSA